MTGIVILGATSAIAEAYARLLVQESRTGPSFFLVGRDETALRDIAADLEARGAESATIRVMDLSETQDPGELVEAARESLERIDEVLVAYGFLPDQETTQSDRKALELALNVNFTSVAVWVQAFANVLKEQKRGSMAVIGSVAGDRGRMSNYAYGAAKGGLERFVQGLQHALASYPNISVTLVKPGFVKTPMTAHIEGRGGPLWAKPDRIAVDIYKAVRRERARIYTPWFWWGIMTIICAVPSRILHKTKL